MSLRSVTISLFVTACLAVGAAPASGAAQQALPRSRQYRTVLTLIGSEYEDAHNNLLNGPRPTPCPRLHPSPMPPGCWTWSANHLGRGTYQLERPHLDATQITWTIVFTDQYGDTLTGELHEGFIPDPSPTDTVTHANRYPKTYTITGGTGRHAGAAGTLTTTDVTTSVSVDPTTGTAHTKLTTRAQGTIALPTVP